MPRKSLPEPGLVDTWGRRNRKLKDRECETCGKTYRPYRSGSRFCSRPCLWKKNGGHNKKPGPIWWTNQRGYIEGRVWVDGKRVQVKQHRWIMEGIIGRSLHSWEDVHHKNGNKVDNNPGNLELISHGDHARITNSRRAYKCGYKLKLTDLERAKRSERAIRTRLAERGRAAINKARGTE